MNNSEDETFRILSKRPFNEVHEKMIEAFGLTSFPKSEEYRKQLLINAGWTIEEWNTALTKHENQFTKQK